MKTDTTFTKKDYEGEYNVLAQEKKIILLALKKTKGNLKEAHKLLCPTTQPYYSYGFLQKQVKRHGIDLLNVKNELKKNEQERFEQKMASEAHRKRVKENLEKFEIKYGFKLRSAE